MTTFNTTPLRLRLPGNSFLSYMVRRHPEAASQTFTADSPIVLSGGYISEAASPATDIYGFAVRAGRNGTAGQYYAEYVPAIDGLEFNANFLGGSAADNNIAITDVGGTYNVVKDTILADGSNAWYVEDTSDANDGATMVSFETDQTPPNVASPAGFCEAGDTNARPSFVVLTSVRSYD